MNTKKCDVLIIGAGPAGSSAASAAAQEGATVIVAEKNKEIGKPVRCAEYISKGLLGSIKLPANAVSQNITGMRTFLPDGNVQEHKAPGLTIHRDLFDQALANDAQNQGAELLLNTRAVKYDHDDVILEGQDTITNISAKIIVGADGPHSIVGRWMQCRNQHMLPALQMRLALSQPLDYTEVYFRPELFGGYGWLFPKKDIANVGIGMRRSGTTQKELSLCLEQFVKDLKSSNKVMGTPIEYQAGWIPVKPIATPVHNNMLLVGDAAGHTHSITGAGIAHAVMGGQIAGKWAARAALQNDNALLMNYAEEFNEDFADTLDHAFERRTLLEEKWDHLNDIIKETWVTFRGYHSNRPRG
jgi:digeranylgeranylglycerophospholipid reductase